MIILSTVPNIQKYLANTIIITAIIELYSLCKPESLNYFKMEKKIFKKHKHYLTNYLAAHFFSPCCYKRENVNKKNWNLPIENS